jgi:hypothetical protein
MDVVGPGPQPIANKWIFGVTLCFLGAELFYSIWAQTVVYRAWKWTRLEQGEKMEQIGMEQSQQHLVPRMESAEDSK